MRQKLQRMALWLSPSEPNSNISISWTCEGGAPRSVTNLLLTSRKP